MKDPGYRSAPHAAPLEPWYLTPAFQLAVDASPDALLLARGDGVIVLTNSEASRMFGYERDELVGQSVDLLLPDGLGGPHAAQMRAFFARPENRTVGNGRELCARRRDGSALQVEVA